MRNQRNKYVIALFMVLAMISGVGIGYVWAAGRQVVIMSVVRCQFGGLLT